MVAEKAEQKEAQEAQKVEEKPVQDDKAEETDTKDEKEKSPPKVVESKEPAEADDVVKKEKEEEEEKPKIEVKSEKSEDTNTLILSAEEEAEISAQTNEDAVKEKPAPKKRAQKNVWVSNITKSTKAADLKKLFSEKFKVETARIVTNGKTFFGYICLETTEMAENAVKDLNNATLAGKKVCVSLSRPDLRRTAPTDSSSKRNKDKKDSRATNGVKKNGDKDTADEKKKNDDAKGENNEKDTKETSSTDEKKKEEDPTEELARLRRRETRLNRLVQELRTDVKRVTTELQNNRRRLTDSQRRLDAERDRKTSLRREIENLQVQMKSEKRKYLQEIEILEKKRKMDEIRYQDDRAVLSRELDECRKLREYLQRKIDDIGIARHQRNSPPRRSSSDKMPRSRHSDGRASGRSPPPPPKINSNRRSRDNSPYKSGKKPRVDDHRPSYGNNHYPPSQSSSYSSNSSKPMVGYPQSGPQRPFSGTIYPDRYGSSGGYPSGSGYLGGSGSSSLMGRPIGYPTSGGPRKY